MTEPRFSPEDVITAMEAVVKEAGPEFTYTASPHLGCRYEPDERNPMGCVVAATMLRLTKKADIYIDFVEEAGVEYQPWAPGREVSDEFPRMPERLIDECSAAMLDKAQNVQDRKGTWGEALEIARATGRDRGCLT